MTSLNKGLQEFAQFAAKPKGVQHYTLDTVFATFAWPQFDPNDWSLRERHRTLETKA